MIEEEIDYARYATFATLRSLRYATLQTEEDRRKNDEGFFRWCRIERERRRKRKDKRDIPEKRRLSIKDREKYSPEKQNPGRERRRRSRNGNNSIMLRNHSNHKLPRSVPPQSTSHK